MTTSRRMNAQAATPHRTPSITKAIALLNAEGLRRRKLNFGNGEGRIGPDQDSAERGGGAGRDDDGKKGAVGNLRQQNFQREQHAAERRIEGRGDARAGAGGKQRDLLPGREPDRLGEGRTQRRADLDDRALRDRPPRRCRSTAPTPAT